MVKLVVLYVILLNVTESIDDIEDLHKVSKCKSHAITNSITLSGPQHGIQGLPQLGFRPPLQCPIPSSLMGNEHSEQQ